MVLERNRLPAAMMPLGGDGGERAGVGSAVPHETCQLVKDVNIRSFQAFLVLGLEQLDDFLHLRACIAIQQRPKQE